jgi:hypothetical protein
VTFTVHDFVTDDAVPGCLDRTQNFSISFTGDAPLTIVANIAPGLTPGSVGWTYDDVVIAPHNLFPYSLGPDDAGDFGEPVPPLTPGDHELTVTVWAEADGMGLILAEATITVTIVGD